MCIFGGAVLTMDSLLLGQSACLQSGCVHLERLSGASMVLRHDSLEGGRCVITAALSTASCTLLAALSSGKADFASQPETAVGLESASAPCYGLASTGQLQPESLGPRLA